VSRQAVERESASVTEVPGIVLRVELPADALDAIAARVAEVVVAQIAATKSELMTVDEAAEFLCCERQRVYDLLSSGRLTRRKDGSRTLLIRAEVEAHSRGETLGPIAQRLPSARRARTRSEAAA
jgi:excisionase family DNA binding protein